jgi:tetratricopeptide (TPR) repeat protein
MFSMSKSNLQTVLLAAFIVVGFGLVFILSDMLEARRTPISAFEDEDLYLSSQRMKAWSGDFNGLVADWYWISSLQYIGRKIVKSHEAGTFNIKDMHALNPTQLYPMLDRTTTLDPDYSAAYTFGAIILPAINEQEAIKLTEKGIAANPDEWVLYQHLGYIYWQRGDYQKAAEVYDQGSQIKDAPAFMKQMSAKVRLEGGTRETAREIYRHIFNTAEDTQTRDLVAMRLAQIDSLDERDAIRKALQEMQQKTGRCVRSWPEIFAALRAIKLPNGNGLAISREGLPLDPSGAAYVLANAGEKCDVELDLVTTKIPPG